MAKVPTVDAFADYTTMHGFSRIIKSKPKPQKIAWIIVFTTAWIFFAVGISHVIRSYFQYPKTLTTNIVLGGVPFPDITLCNLGSFDIYTVYRLSEGLPSLVHPNPKQKEEKYLNDTLIRAMNKYYHVMNKSASLSVTDRKLYFDKMFSRTTVAANIPPAMLSANGYQEDEFIVKCTYRNKPCKFKKIFDPYFFNCYTFTAPNVTSTTEDETTPLFEGIENGLTVMLLAGTGILKELQELQFAAIPGFGSKDSALSGAEGVRVVIHPPGTKPFPLTEGYDVPPGHMAGLSLAPKKRERLGQPYGHCNEKYPFLNKEEKMLPSQYRKTACEKVCIQKEIYKECNCYDNTLPTDVDLLPDDDDDAMLTHDTMRVNTARKRNLTKLQEYCFKEEYLVGNGNANEDDPCKKIEKCSGTNEFHKCFKYYSTELPKCSDHILQKLLKNIKCADEVKDRVMANAALLSQCGCHPSCNEFLYDVAYSLSQWPSQGVGGDPVVYEMNVDLRYWERILSPFPEKMKYYGNYVTKDIKRALKDFSKINVYVSDANVFLTKEEPAMTATQLISDIGGQLGIWIGVSVLTIAEVLEIFILMVMEKIQGGNA